MYISPLVFAHTIVTAKPCTVQHEEMLLECTYLLANCIIAYSKHPCSHVVGVAFAVYITCMGCLKRLVASLLKSNSVAIFLSVKMTSSYLIVFYFKTSDNQHSTVSDHSDCQKGASYVSKIHSGHCHGKYSICSYSFN